jgi:hypothetical protein
MNGAFERVSAHPGERELAPWLAALALLALLVEVAMRRLLTGQRVAREGKAPHPLEKSRSASQPVSKPAADDRSEAPARQPEPEQAAVEPSSGLEAALSQAKRRARR